MTNSTNGKKLQTLLIEDNPRDTLLIKEILSESVNPEISVEVADRLSRGIRRISDGGIDLILLDLKLPDSNWYDTFLKVRDNRMEKIVEFSKALNARGSLKDLLDTAKDMIPHLFFAELFSIFRLVKKSKELILEAHNHKEWSEPPETITVPASNSIMWDAVRTKDMVAVKNFSQSPYAGTWSRRKYKNDAAVCIPFVVRQEVLGVLNLNLLTSNWSSAANLHNIQTACNHFALAYHLVSDKAISNG